jgi:hypothetical protein
MFTGQDDEKIERNVNGIGHELRVIQEGAAGIVLS